MNEEQKIKEAVEIVKNSMYGLGHYEKELEATQILISLAQDYLSCGELEEMKWECGYQHQDCYDAERRGWNEAVRQHNLIMLKKREELKEKIDLIMHKWFWSKGNRNEETMQHEPPKDWEEINTALKNELMGEGR